MIDSLTSQFRSALAMLRAAIDAYPDELWTDTRFVNPAWRIAYHALFYTHLYLSPSEDEFTPWEHSLAGANFMSEPLESGAVPNTRQQIVAYLEWVDGFIPSGLSNKPFDAPSGFDWITFDRGQLHVYNLRHLQHHTGQLNERLKAETGTSVDWVGSVDR